MATQRLISPHLWVYDVSPCETCPRASQCRDQLQACEQFRQFFLHGGRQWTSAPREPSREIYLQIEADHAG